MRHEPPFAPPAEVIDLPGLRLRRPRASDASAVFEFASDPEVARYADWPITSNIESVIQLLRDPEISWAAGSELYWVITLPSDDRAIGGIACSVKGEAAEFGFLVNSRFWRKGYATEAILREVDSMPAAPSSSPKQFVQGAPVLHVPDVVATATFYRDVLGFTWDFGDETYAVVWRDNSAIHFVRDVASPKGVHLFQWVKDIDSYYKEIIGRGAEAATEPRNQPYGIREFGVQDINGVGVVFGQDIATQE